MKCGNIIVKKRSGGVSMGRKIICPECKTIFDEEVLKAKNSENTCLVCNASLSGDDSHAEPVEPQPEPEEELVTWYYYDLGGGTYYLDDVYRDDTDKRKITYTFQAPKELDKAKEVLRREYKSDAFAEPTPDDDYKHKSPQQLIHEGRCPRCGSHNIQIVQRKWSLLTGFLTNKVDRVCVNCKYRF